MAIKRRKKETFSRWDAADYLKSDDDMAAINIVRADFHGEWNYTIKPINRSKRAADS